jgi:hypothetical protein
MMESGSAGQTEMLASFFKRLEAIDAILRVIVSEAKIRAALTLRGNPERRVLLDFSSGPARVTLDEQAKEADVSIAIRGEVMHEILCGRMSAGRALGERELLLRGSSSNLARLIPLFDFGPVLYREHLEKPVLTGSSTPSDSRKTEEKLMERTTFEGKPIPLVSLSSFEKLMFGALNAISYSLGYLVGLLRYRVFEKLNLFDVLSAMSRGLAAASPQARLESGNPRD